MALSASLPSSTVATAQAPALVGTSPAILPLSSRPARTSPRALSVSVCFARARASAPPIKHPPGDVYRCLCRRIPLSLPPDPRRISSRSLCVGVSTRSDKMLNDSSMDVNLDEFEKELKGFFLEVKKMLKMGDKDGAADLLLANYEATKEQIDNGFKGIEQVATLDIVALGYMAAGELKFVEQLLDMLTDMVGGLSDDTRLLASVLVHMGSMYTTLRKFDEAIAVYSRALRILAYLFGEKNPFLVMPLLGKANVLMFIGKSVNAIEDYKEAVDILEANRGCEIVELVMPLSALGNIFLSEGRTTEAESCFKRILSICEKAYGRSDGRVGMARCFLARALCAKGNIEEAIQEYESGLQIVLDSKYMASDNDGLQKMRMELAELLHVAGRLQEGRELLEECLLIAERSKGSKNPRLVPHLLNLSTSYLRSKNYVEAERLVRFALQLMPKKMKPGGQDFSAPQLQLAVILFNQGREEEAERIAREVLHFREEAFGKYSLPVGEALDCLTSIQAKLGEDDLELLEQLKRILEIQEMHSGYESEDVMETLKKIIFFLDKTGNKDQKAPLVRRLSVLRSKYRNKVLV